MGGSDCGKHPQVRGRDSGLAANPLYQQRQHPQLAARDGGRRMTAAKVDLDLVADSTERSPIEQARRDFQSENPHLYTYIADLEAAKALDAAGDCISTHDAAANVVWALSSE